MIELQNISKTFRVVKKKSGAFGSFRALFRREYQEVKALDGVSFSIDKGEIVGFIGPNGAGKSTTIKIMSGILVPDSGNCTVMGQTPWKNRKHYVRHIGVVFGQRTQLWWDVPVEDSFELLRDIYSIPPERFGNNKDELVSILDLRDLLHVPLRQLSLGQRMRCEIAASLLHEPEVLFLDEPTIGLDAVSKLAVRRFIREINERRQITVILTTHDMADIEALTDRILLIGKGNILYDGSMNSIREKYDTERHITVSFEPCANPLNVEHAQLVSWSDTRAEYQIDTGKTNTARVLSALNQQLSIQDMTVESRPVEEIIAALYRERKI